MRCFAVSLLYHYTHESKSVFRLHNNNINNKTGDKNDKLTLTILIIAVNIFWVTNH